MFNLETWTSGSSLNTILEQVIKAITMKRQKGLKKRFYAQMGQIWAKLAENALANPNMFRYDVQT